jgi:hypothetical protein
MKAIFYDRKNNREVSSEELVPITLVEEYVIVDGDGCSQYTQYDPNKFDSYITSKSLGELGYKSEVCRTVCNWDLFTDLSELVFLRLE